MEGAALVTKMFTRPVIHDGRCFGDDGQRYRVRTIPADIEPYRGEQAARVRLDSFAGEISQHFFRSRAWSQHPDVGDLAVEQRLHVIAVSLEVMRGNDRRRPRSEMYGLSQLRRIEALDDTRPGETRNMRGGQRTMIDDGHRPTELYRDR